jgi:hypothetical protein
VRRFSWDFSISGDQEAFTGIFSSLFGLTDTQATFDGSMINTVAFPEHTLDLDRIDGALNEPGGPRRLLEVCVELAYQGGEDLLLRVELKDLSGGVRFTRLPFVSSTSPQRHCWDFRDPFFYRIPAGRDLDLHEAKELTLIIERQHVGDEVSNPERGTLDLRRLWFVVDRDDLQPADDQALLDLTARRAYQYFLDWSSRKPPSAGIPQDRSTFGDLLTVGGIGFALPAHIIAAERGWIARSEAAMHILNVLRTLDDPNAFGPEPTGRIGHHGWFYHFLGTDGRRKLNFDFLETPNVNETLNTVELSTIDTGLALMGVLAAQSYFQGDDPAEVEIRTRAQVIYDRVDWRFLLRQTTPEDPDHQQFYLGWKPHEPRTGPPFEVPDAAGEGTYSGTPGDPATLDFYTDEALIVTLLALGSTTHTVPVEVYCAWKRARDPDGFVRTYPGSLFTFRSYAALLSRSSAGRARECPWKLSWRLSL